jgi:hypothetical protein
MCYPPTRWGTATFLPPCYESSGQRDRWEMDRSYVKNIVYQVKFNDLQHLKAHIRDMLEATSNVTQIFTVPPRGPTLKFTEKAIYSGKKKRR